MPMQFTFEMVDGPATVRGQCFLVLDANGNPRIAYADLAGNVALAQRDAGALGQGCVYRVNVEKGGNA